jgi:CMP-N-acetylneuraminic acid synthetase
MNAALITARGGSKGLKRKNILPFFGKPLIAWSIEAAIKSKHVDECYVSTEDKEIAMIAKTFGAKIIDRPQNLALDDSTSEQVILHCIESLTESGVDIDLIVLLQPTSPLRTECDIDRCVDKYIETKADCIISVYEPKHSAAKAYRQLDNGIIKGLFTDSAPYQARQTLPRTFQPNGALYVFSKESFLKSNQIPRDKVYPYQMPESLSVDIDTKEDFEYAESLMRKKHEA